MMNIAINRIESNSLSGFSIISASWFLLVLPVGSWLSWHTPFFWNFPKSWLIVLLSSCAFFISATIMHRLHSLPLGSGGAGVFLCYSLSFLVVIFVVAWGRFYYSRSFLAFSYLLGIAILLFYLRFVLQGKLRRLALVPGGMVAQLSSLPGVEWVPLASPRLVGETDGVVVDLHQKLAPDWMRFLSNCALQRVPVYHSGVVFETLTGRASMLHFSDGILEAVLISPFYAMLKRGADLLLVLMLFPLCLPLMAIIAVLIKIDSKGPILFSQERVGKGGKIFKMLKFRSMYVAGGGGDAAFAKNNDSRITGIGKLIRKFRLDELPQFFNVLRGDMSIIGPRPEQVSFSEKFQKEIPYYSYRHLVRPGISGWAQVHQGYVDDCETTKNKLEFDLFYIKYLSFWLDTLIVFKTIKTVLTGFGAR